MVKVAFVVGIPNHPQEQEKLELEQSLYCDILQVNVQESYYNLTLKTAYSIQYFYRNNWNEEHGPPDFLMKGDDDIYVNIPKLVALANSYNDKRYFAICLLFYVMGDEDGISLTF